MGKCRAIRQRKATKMILILLLLYFANISLGLTGRFCRNSDRYNLRVFAGTTARPNEFPWMARISLNEATGNFCGGSVIGEKWIITAGHCCHDDSRDWPREMKFAPTYDLTGIRIRVGAHLDSTCYNCNNCNCEYKYRYLQSFRNQDNVGYSVEADKLFMHPKYNLKAGWDYCLVRLKNELQFDCSVKPIELAGLNDDGLFGSKCLTAGWG